MVTALFFSGSLPISAFESPSGKSKIWSMCELGHQLGAKGLTFHVSLSGCQFCLVCLFYLKIQNIDQ